MKYLIGQRVIVGSNVIAMVTPKPRSLLGPEREGCVWVRHLHDDVVVCYDEKNVRPLPGGQL